MHLSICFEDVYIVIFGLTVDLQWFRAACSDMYPTAGITCKLHRRLLSTTEHWSAQSTQSTAPLNIAPASCTELMPHASCTLLRPARGRATTKPHVLPHSHCPERCSSARQHETPFLQVGLGAEQQGRCTVSMLIKNRLAPAMRSEWFWAFSRKCGSAAAHRRAPTCRKHMPAAQNTGQLHRCIQGIQEKH